MAGLTRQIAHSTLEDDFKRNDLSCGTEKTKGWVLSGSPQSMLCAVRCRCGCRQGSSHGSPNGSSPPATWDLLYEAAGEVERTIGFEPVWKEKKLNRTKPKLIGLNRFSARFGSKNIYKKFNLIVYSGSKPDQTRNAQPYLT
ncbi:hypothetical protein Peur_029356 [Populus x canadensis]